MRDQYYDALPSRLVLVGKLSTGNGYASSNPTRIPSRSSHTIWMAVLVTSSIFLLHLCYWFVAYQLPIVLS